MAIEHDEMPRDASGALACFKDEYEALRGSGLGETTLSADFQLCLLACLSDIATELTSIRIALEEKLK